MEVVVQEVVVDAMEVAVVMVEEEEGMVREEAGRGSRFLQCRR